MQPYHHLLRVYGTAIQSGHPISPELHTPPFTRHACAAQEGGHPDGPSFSCATMHQDIRDN